MPRHTLYSLLSLEIVYAGKGKKSREKTLSLGEGGPGVEEMPDGSGGAPAIHRKDLRHQPEGEQRVGCQQNEEHPALHHIQHSYPGPFQPGNQQRGEDTDDESVVAVDGQGQLSGPPEAGPIQDPAQQTLRVQAAEKPHGSGHQEDIPIVPIGEEAYQAQKPQDIKGPPVTP